MTDRKYSLGIILESLAQELDVPESKYKEAEQHYNAVGNWLGDDDSELARFEPIIYAQGSFALGTAIKPKGDDDYDVDAVCLLQNLGQHEVTQKQLKQMVGDRLLHEKSRYKKMLDPKTGGRRCWTIKYADASKFHLDVLPAIPVYYGTKDGPILITDKEEWDICSDWPMSNPKGYAAWFIERMKVRFEEAARSRAIELKAEVQKIQVFQVRTPLQRLIQLLKRHRDERYNGDEDKPISIIITTLAAQAYNNEGSLVDALLNVVPNMRNHIQVVGGRFWIPNPVNPSENFADKWEESPSKAKLFFEWLAAVETEHKYLLTESGFQNTDSYLRSAYGQQFAAPAMIKSAQSLIETGISTAAPIVLTPSKTTFTTTVSTPRPRTEISSTASKPWGVG